VTDKRQPQKPKAVIYAEYALLAWTAWICSFGVYQSWKSIPELEAMVTSQFQGMMSLPPAATLLEIVIAGYALLALTVVWLIWKIGQGKKWARSSLLLSVALQALWDAAPPYHGMLAYLPDIPDLGLQLYAVYLLYTWPGRTWFNREEWATDASP
jgi:hypothetical protein